MTSSMFLEVEGGQLLVHRMLKLLCYDVLNLIIQSLGPEYRVHMLRNAEDRNVVKIISSSHTYLTQSSALAASWVLEPAQHHSEHLRNTHYPASAPLAVEQV